MKRAIAETERRRKVQSDYNKAHGITPKTIIKEIKNSIIITSKADEKTEIKDIPAEIEKLKGLMAVASSSLDFETAIKMRDRIAELKKIQTKLNKKY
jgi:excinuclease ABC subunit B